MVGLFTSANRHTSATVDMVIQVYCIPSKTKIMFYQTYEVDYGYDIMCADVSHGDKPILTSPYGSKSILPNGIFMLKPESITATCAKL